MSTEWIAIQRNPKSGRGAGRSRLHALISRLRRDGFGVRSFQRRDRLDAWLADPQRRAATRCVVAAGGDGTVRDIVQRFPDLRVAVFPLGTENLLAKYLGVTGNPLDAVNMIRAGRAVEFNICEADSRKFLLMLSVGFDADVVRRVDERRAGNITKWSYVKPFWQSLRNYDYPEIRVTVDGMPEALCGRQLVLSNFPAYGMGLPFSPFADPTDGKLDLRLFQNGSASRMIKYLYYLWRNRHERLDDMLTRRGTVFRVESDVPVPVQIDGDAAGFTPLTVRVAGMIRLIVPESFSLRAQGVSA